MATIAILPARRGSKRIKNKNIVEFCGTPMIAYALEATSKSQLFDKIHVSTDSVEIKNIVESLGYPVEFMRPSELAGDTVGTIPVLQWVLEKYNSLNKNYDDVFNIMPAAPFLKSDDLTKAYELYLKHKRKHSVHVVTEFPVPIEWSYRRKDNGTINPINPGAYAIRSQDLEKAYYETGPFSIFNVTHLSDDDPVTDEGFISYVMPKDRAIDIDDEQDLAFAKKIFLGEQALENEKK